jgi:hypothetical protein
VDALTGSIELLVGLACVAVGIGAARTRPSTSMRLLGAGLAIAGSVAVVHALAALTSSITD